MYYIIFCMSILLCRPCMCVAKTVFDKGRWMKFICSNDCKHNIDGTDPWVSWLIGSDTLAWA